MRALLWLVLLFLLATLLALLAGGNQAVVTVYWSPTRAIDLSLNLIVAVIVGLFLLGFALLRGVQILSSLPQQAQRWRTHQKERAMHGHLLDAMSYQMAGRYGRARTAAGKALEQDEGLYGKPDQIQPAEPVVSGRKTPPHAVAPAYRMQLRTLAHSLMADSSQRMQDADWRDACQLRAEQEGQQIQGSAAAETREGLLLRSVRWALDSHQPDKALQQLDQLPQGAGRRMAALRYRLRAAQQIGDARQALETARVLVRHKAFSELAGKALIQQLAADWLRSAQDVAQLQQHWRALDAQERSVPAIALAATERLQLLGGSSAQSAQWLLPVWEQLVEQPDALAASQRQSVLLLLGDALNSLDAGWLQRIEQARQRHPRQAELQYLDGLACLQRQLPDQARQLLEQALPGLQQAPALRRQAWMALARLAEQRADSAAALEAWKQAATTAV